MPDSVIWQALWVLFEATILVAALFARRRRTAVQVGRLAGAALFLVGGALFNALNLVTGGDYADFAEGSYVPFVHHITAGDLWSPRTSGCSSLRWSCSRLRLACSC